jgi:hypothetical protein
MLVEWQTKMLGFMLAHTTMSKEAGEAVLGIAQTIGVDSEEEQKLDEPRPGSFEKLVKGFSPPPE